MSGGGPAQDTLARTLYGEARGTLSYGTGPMIGVANVVMNRTRDASRFGGGVEGVCTAQNQFSCWNIGDPNRAVIESVTLSDPVFQQCWQIAGQAIAGALSDNTGGAEFYYDHSISEPGNWRSMGVEPTVTLGPFTFGAFA